MPVYFSLGALLKQHKNTQHLAGKWQSLSNQQLTFSRWSCPIQASCWIGYCANVATIGSLVQNLQVKLVFHVCLRQQSIAISQANFKINRTSIDANSLHQAALKHLIANRVHLNSWSCIFYSRRKYIGFCVWFQFNFKCLPIKFVKKENFYVLEN